jgi:signal transduction histidine kinase
VRPARRLRLPSGPRARLWTSVRARTTLLAASVVAVALVAGAAAVLVTLQHQLLRGVDDTAKARARDLASVAAAGALPPHLTPRDEDEFVQVVNGSGAVVATSGGHADRVLASFPVQDRGPAVGQVSVVGDGGEREDFRVWGVRGWSDGEPLAIYVGTNLEPVEDTVTRVRGLLLGVLPLLLGLLALSAWVLLGRALRPVEAIRAEVADISDRALDRRVPVPRAEDEVGRLARTMNAMLDRLEAASRRERTFVADASHELQSPLTALRTQLEVALAHGTAADWRRTAAALLTDSQRMERLVRDLLFLARADGVPGPHPVSPLDLDDIVLAEATRLRATTATRLDTSRVSAAPVCGSRDELTRLTRNLLENADRHSASAVLVELATHDGSVRLVVQDDGPGIPTGERERIFDRFVRGDGARSHDGGTGLGLAIVKEIAERHGGSVEVEDGAAGARFVVRLPQQA